MPPIAYLIGRYPAINHHYLLVEVAKLRELGWHIETISVAPPDRKPHELRPEELSEAGQTFYVNSAPKAAVVAAVLHTVLTRPLGVLRALACAWTMGGRARARVRSLAYLGQALVVGRHLARLGIKHLHVSFSGTVGYLVTECFPVTMSLGVYGFGELHDPQGSSLRDKLRRSVFVRSVSRHGVNELMLCARQADWDKLEYAPLGVLPENFPARHEPQQQQIVHLLSVGRLSPEKGQLLLLRALASLPADSSVLVHLAGDGPDRQHLESEAYRLGVASKVVFEGRVSQDRLMELYRAADGFLLSSLAEGTPIVLMEAMSMEIPCIAPRITGIPEVVGDGEGLLYTAADILDLARAITQLSTQPDWRRVAGRKGRDKILQHYDLRRNTEHLSTLFHKYL